ncbi:YkgJ family cysteine cluster protein [Bacteroidales bacterium OttesenSCG-928-I21]|nr:YkgJ family cysteine cluster protein [Bacteroidales bacterium OttesenSCG-928-I21]
MHNKCRKCGACCIAPSISSEIPGMKTGKAKNQKCIHLTNNKLCELFDNPNRPKVCIECKPDPVFCGKNFDEAIKIFNSLE